MTSAWADEPSSSSVRTLVVAFDDNYPPYVFRDATGALTGYLVDYWKLWEQKTGVPVDFLGSDWGLAQARMGSHQADVIDTIFETPERQKTLDFTASYATIPVSIYAHVGIGGISDLQHLKGFVVGAKAGDACIDNLKSGGVTTVQPYANYESLVQAAIAGQVRIICLDEPPANYLMYREHAEDDFKKAFQMDAGELHRGVHKGDTRTMALLQSGFAAISEQEDQALRNKWMGTRLLSSTNIRYVTYGIIVALLVGAALLMWGTMLRRKVGKKTADLDAERARLQALLQAIPDLVWMKDMNGVYRFCNPAFERFFGAKEAAIVGKTDYDFVEKELADFFRANDQLAIHADRPTINEEWITFADDGHRAFLETTKTPMRSGNGQLDGVLGISRDITERKAIEAKLQMHQEDLQELVDERTKELNLTKQAAESANMAKSTFLANMSHELRTPLGGVMGMIDLAMGRASDPQQIDWLKKSKRSAQYLLSVINDILDISKIEADRLTLEERNFSVSQGVDDAMVMLDDAALGKHLNLTLELDPAVPDMLCGDAIRLKQIVLNYLSNAIKFSERGNVKLRTHLVEQDETGVMLRIEVSDQGMGISAEQQARLFQSFTQADNSTTRKFGGSGLGLFISKRLACLMGGDTGVLSQEGQGSTFWAMVRLRHAQDNRQTDERTQAFSPRELLEQHCSGQRVLLVEDDEVNQEVGLLMLEAVGLVVELAVNGREAVEKASSGTYALILMDVQMPEMNGLEATRAIRMLPGLQHTPIVAMSANAFTEDRERSLDAGMNDHIGKPVLPEMLYSTLLRWMP